MSWITLTVDDLAAYINAGQLAALKTAQLQEGQSDPVSDIIDEICDGIRLEISSCATNVLSATEHSIPPELKAEAAHLIIESAQGRISIALSLSDDQVRNADNARTKLTRIAACKLNVSKPSDPESTGATTTRTTGITTSQPRNRQVTRNSMKGLM